MRCQARRIFILCFCCGFLFSKASAAFIQDYSARGKIIFARLSLQELRRVLIVGHYMPTPSLTLLHVRFLAKGLGLEAFTAGVFL